MRRITLEMTPEIEKFMTFVRNDCKANNINLVLSKDDHVSIGSSKCNGYFDEDDKILAVATGQDFSYWFKIFIHEYGHMTQWKDKCSVWVQGEKELAHPETIVDLWFDRKIELTEAQLDYWIPLARNIELDCEKRVIGLIEKFNLPINKKDYIKNANAYVYFWTYLRKTRKWYTIGKEPYKNELILAAMPDHFDNDYNQIPNFYERLYNQFTTAAV